MAVVPGARALPDSIDFLPVLSRGKHRHPSRGACFMEYTALLAGEPFSDAPRCVDRELAAVLRHANDTLSDADRPRLLPLLGRSIGLAVRPPVTPPGQEPGDDDIARYACATVLLHRRVSALLMAAIGHEPTPEELRLHDGGRDVDDLFWYLMHEPSVLRTPTEYVDRLIERLDVLHDCFERALSEQALPRVEVHHEPAATPPPCMDPPPVPLGLPPQGAPLR
jgi:hypothetical protein